jgi:photosystem II stability/assembly factor-like uncharacterized protein
MILPARRLIVALLSLLALAAPAVRAQGVRLPPAYLAPLAARGLGPAGASGRVTAVAVVESRPAVRYVGTAAGGVWKTTDAGRSWTPVFDDQPALAIGAVAVAGSDPDVVWVGTGEANPRNSVSWGNGLYRSTDGGRTWQHRGLSESHHVGRIVIHPRDPNTVWVAALGHLWGPNRERGVFKTTDGGRTWQHSLALDADTGCVDLAIDPGDPQTLYAAAYCVRRDAYAGIYPAVQFGPKAGLYRSRDGGATWARLTRGLPNRSLGRCGLAVWRKDPRVLYAVVQTDRTVTRKLEGQPPRRGGKVETGGVFRSDDRGETWIKLNDLVPRPFYFGQVRIDPTDDRRVYVLGVPLFVSRDGGRTFRPDGARNAHVDHHDLWIDPTDPERLVLCTDGGVYHSANGGRTWEHVRNLPVAQFYGITADLRKPYRVYGGLQDNGTWGGPSRPVNPDGGTPGDWKRYLKGDGFHCVVDPGDPNTLYAEMHFGQLFRVEVGTGKRTRIQPHPPKGAAAYRFNWSSPLLLSPHDTNTLYFGGNHLFASGNRGASWRRLGPDLTHGRPGRSRSGGHTITTIAESPVQAGVLWVGTDDGRLVVSRDAGRNWTDVRARLVGVPAPRWVSRVECSPLFAGTAFVALDRHRLDDRAPYLFRTDDFGVTWKSLSAGLPPEGPVYVVRADRRNRDLLYVGTENGLFLSLDAGATWLPFRNGLPAVPVHDLLVHPRDRDLVIATHGRGAYVLDAAPLQEMTAAVLAAPVHLFDVKPVLLPRGRSRRPGARASTPANPPTFATIYVAMREKPARPGRLSIVEAVSGLAAELSVPPVVGLQRIAWDLRATSGGRTAFVGPGLYFARLEVGDLPVQTKVFRVETEE